MNADDYWITPKRPLSADERRSLQEEHSQNLRALSSRYLPDLSIDAGIPAKIEYADALRGMWLLDSREDRPPYSVVVSGVGYVFGMLLEALLGMEWFLAEDPDGEFVALVKKNQRDGAQYNEIVVPLFNYVGKREATQDVEVFADGFREFKRMIDGDATI